MIGSSNKILDKIRKLMTLAKDDAASEGEIENAMKMAKTLMMKHNISEKSIDIDIDISDINEHIIEAGHGKYYEYEHFE